MSDALLGDHLPDETGPAVAALGHNDPPDEFALLVERVNDLVEAANRWAVERPKITDAVIATRCQDFLDQIGAASGGKGSGCLGQIEVARLTEKRPHLDAAAAVDARYAPLKTLLETVKDILGPRRADWLRREQARLDAERVVAESRAKALRESAEAKQREAEAGTGTVVQNTVAAASLAKQADAAEAALAQTPTRAILRGELGARGRGLRTVWFATEPASRADWNLLYRHLRDDPSFQAELKQSLMKFAQAEVRAGARAVPGCTVTSRQE